MCNKGRLFKNTRLALPKQSYFKETGLNSNYLNTCRKMTYRHTRPHIHLIWLSLTFFAQRLIEACLLCLSIPWRYDQTKNYITVNQKVYPSLLTFSRDSFLLSFFYFLSNLICLFISYYFSLYVYFSLPFFFTLCWSVSLKFKSIFISSFREFHK